MWFKTILRPKTRGQRPATTSGEAQQPLFDERFLRSLEQLELHARRTLSGNPASGQHRSRHLLPTTTFSEHRPYTPGDDPRYVDWNAYGRHEQVLVKQGEAEQDVHIHLIVDSSASMAWGGGSKARYARRLAAAVGYLALSASDRLHISPFERGSHPPFGPAQGKRHVIELLKYLDALPAAQSSDLSRTMRDLARRSRRGGMVVLCSDLLSTSGLEAGLAALHPPRWQTIVLHLSDPRELEPPLEGPLELVDSETGASLEVTIDEPTRAAYREHLAAWREQIAGQCRRAGALYAPIQTDWGLDQTVIPYLRARNVFR